MSRKKRSRLVLAALAFGPLWWFAVQWLGLPVWGHGLLWLAGLNTAWAWLLAWLALDAKYSGWASFARALVWGLQGGIAANLLWPPVWRRVWGIDLRAELGHTLVLLVLLQTLVFWALIAFSDFMAREPEQGDGSDSTT